MGELTGECTDNINAVIKRVNTLTNLTLTDSAL